MGVRLLFTYLQEHVDALSTNTVFPPKDNQRATVLVDGYGFLITLAIKSIALGMANSGPNHHEGDASSPDGSMPIFHDVDIIGGDAFVVEEACRRCIRRLRNELGMDLVIAVDAPRGIDGATCQRDVVWDSRHWETQQNTLHHYKYARGLTQHKHLDRPKRGDGKVAHTKDPLPFLTTINMKKVLAEFDGASDNLPPVKVIHLDAEVDELVGQLATTHKAQFILSSDTDMLVAPIGLPVLLLQHMPWKQLLSPTGTVHKLPFHTFSRRTLGKHLGLDIADNGSSKTDSSTGPYDDNLLLLLAASLCGNDVTTGVCQEGKIDVVVNMLKELRTKLSNGDSTEGLRVAELLNHPLTAQSVEQYLKAGDTSEYFPAKLRALTVPGALESNHSHPKWTRCKKEFDRFVRLYQEGAVPPRFLPMLLSDLVFHGDAPYDNSVGSHLRPFHTLPTAQRIEIAERALLQRQRQKCGCALDATTEANNDTAAKQPLHPNDIPTRSWFDVYTTASHEEKKHITYRLFCGSRQSIAEILDASPAPASASATGEVVVGSDSDEDEILVFDANKQSGFQETKHTISFLEAVLWAAHPALYSNEVRLLATMAVVMRLRKTEPTLWKELFKGFCSTELLEERPAPRCLELTNIIADAYDTVANFSKLIGGGFDDVPSPGNFFSGTLLHCLGCSNPGAWKAFLPGAIEDEILAVTSHVNTLVHHHEHDSRGEESLQHSWGFLSGRPAQTSRFSSRWIGVLHRDELVDMLDEGEADVEKGGQVIPQGRNTAPVQPNKVEETSAPLPILEHMDTILDAIGNHNVVCIQGETGCGKSSMIPLHILLDAQRRGEHVNIVVTQPRRIAATSLAERVASLLGEKVGGRVGYRIGGGAEFHKESRRTCIRFVTTGYLLESLVAGGKLWKHVTHILLDEVHERSLQADMLSLVVKLTMKPTADSSESDDEADTKEKRHEAEVTSAIQKRLVVMSATIQADMFRNYFAPLTPDGVVPTLQVGARRCQVVEFFLDEWHECFKDEVPTEVAKGVGKYLHKIQTAGAKPVPIRDQMVNSIADVALGCVSPGTCILVFLPGLEEIEHVLESISVVAKRNRNTICAIKLYALHSVVDIDEQRRIVAETAPDECKVVLATNIAETSITIPDVKVVIDVGQARRMEYDADRRIRALRCGWCSKSAAKQRAGRAGRVSDGVIIRMYTEEMMDEVMPDFDPSEFLPLEYSVLQIRQHLTAYGSITDVMSQLVEPPPKDAVEDAITRLVQWGALGGAPEYSVTDLGQVALMMPIDVTLSRAILTAAAMGCAAEMTVIAAGITAQRPLFIRPLRNFFDDDHEFLENLVASCRTAHHFDRGMRSDLHSFLAAYEELGHLRRHKMAELRDSHNVQIATRAVSTFVKYAKQLARSVLQLGVALTADDEKRLQHIVTGVEDDSDDEDDSNNRHRKHKKPQRLRFGVWESPTAERTLQLALVSASEMVAMAPRTFNSAFYNKDSSHKRATPDRVARSVVFDGVTPTITAVGEEKLKEIMRPICGNQMSVTVQRRTVTMRFDIDGEAKVLEKERVAASLKGAEVTSVKKAQGRSSAAAAAAAYATKPTRQEVPSSDDEDDSDKQDEDVGAEAAAMLKVESSVPPTRPNPCVHALMLIKQCHPKRVTAMPIATDTTKEAVQFPQPTVACSYKKIIGLRESGPLCELGFDRWSILNGPADSACHSPWSDLIFAFSVMGQGSSNKMSASASFISSTEQNFPFMAMMSGSAVDKAVHSNKQVTFAVTTVDDQVVVVGVDPNTPSNTSQGGFKRQEVFCGLAGFSAPLHMLVEVNIMRTIQELARYPKDHVEAKEELVAMLADLLKDESNKNPDRALHLPAGQFVPHVPSEDVPAQPLLCLKRVIETQSVNLGTASDVDLFDLKKAFQTEPKEDGDEKKDENSNAYMDKLPAVKRAAVKRLAELCEKVSQDDERHPIKAHLAKRKVEQRRCDECGKMFNLAQLTKFEDGSYTCAACLEGSDDDVGSFEKPPSETERPSPADKKPHQAENKKRNKKPSSPKKRVEDDDAKNSTTEASADSPKSSEQKGDKKKRTRRKPHKQAEPTAEDGESSAKPKRKKFYQNKKPAA